MPKGTRKPLTGTVAVVAGATRGAGRGIARALGEAGARVYCTGRSVRGNPSPYKRPETIDETVEMITAAGGKAIAIRVDHTNEEEVQALFERVQREHRRLDILVNSVAGEDPMMAQWAWWLWKTDLTNADAILRQGLVSHVITAKHAALTMMKKRRGLIVEVTESDLLLGGVNTLAGIVKSSQKVMAAVWAGELRKYGVAVIAITPGFLRSETMLERFGVTEENWRDGGKKDKNFLESESPLFVGRAIAALAQDHAKILQQTGQLFSSWEVGRKYRLTDADGRRPDWGKRGDYSTIPQSLKGAMIDASNVWSDWLKTQTRRTDRFLRKLEVGSGT